LGATVPFVCPIPLWSHLLVPPGPPTAGYSLSLHDALPICTGGSGAAGADRCGPRRRRRLADGPAPRPRGAGFSGRGPVRARLGPDRKSTRLNSSHVSISYAVLCL